MSDGTPADDPAPEVYDYLDYRAFLRDFYAHEKAHRRGFSYRAFSRRAGVASPTHLKRVIDGERNLREPTARRFAKACRLTGDPAEYFVALVQFDQARTVPARDAAYRKVTGFRGYRDAQQLDVAHAAYHSTWYLPAIRELAGRADFRADPAWIAARLLPRVSLPEITRALRTLEALGFLTRDDDTGALVQSAPLVTTGPEMPAVHIARYHMMMMERAAAAIDLVPSPDRDISSVTLLMSEDGVARLKARVQRFRRELLQLTLLESDPSRVVQINFQLFPLSISRDEEPRS